MANESASLYHESAKEWDQIFDRLSSDVNDYKVLCHRMKAKLETFKKERFDLRRNHEDSLRGIATAYNRNRTQLFTVMDEMELAIHDMKNGIEKRSVKQISFMSQLEKDMDFALSEVVQGSG